MRIVSTFLDEHGTSLALSRQLAAPGEHNGAQSVAISAMAMMVHRIDKTMLALHM
jgi:hypothetical protein